MIKIYTFLTPRFEHDFPYKRITLRARKALRVMWYTLLGATRLSRRESPRQGRQNQKISKCHVSDPKISSFFDFTKMSKIHENLDFWGHARDLPAHWKFSQGMHLTQRMPPWIASEFGGAKPKVPPNGNPSPAPSTRTARTARTTRQINGAKSFGG